MGAPVNSVTQASLLHQHTRAPGLAVFAPTTTLQGSKGTTPLTHIGVMPTTLQSAMLHLTRQSQEQPGMIPQNPFNQGVCIVLQNKIQAVLSVRFLTADDSCSRERLL